MAKGKSTEAEFIAAWQKNGGSATAVAKELGISGRAVHSRRRVIEARSGTRLTSSDIRGQAFDSNAEPGELKARVRELEALLKSQQRDTLDEAYVKSKIVKLAEMNPHPPGWLFKPRTTKSLPGVPIMMWSDWHWGEVIDASQIGGVNSYDLSIAHKRARRLVENTIDLLTNHMVNPSYPGVVINLGGDLISGDIHEELTATNEKEVMPVVLDLYGILIECIAKMADAFGNVFIPCVSGNHGRMTHKIRAKGRNFTSFDWLLCVFLQKYFEKDARIKFHIPNGADALYSVYGHRYLLTHGDQFRMGGDSQIGHMGPVIRGSKRKLSRNVATKQEFDTMVHGHWHTYSPGDKIIGNGSLCGYNEYANQGNFSFEEPKQALWICHPVHGITFHMPVNVSGNRESKGESWVAWSEAN